jgi:hypothetical protein
LVYTDVPLEWGAFLISQIYQWDAILSLRAIIPMGGKFIPGIYQL